MFLKIPKENTQIYTYIHPVCFESFHTDYSLTNISHINRPKYTHTDTQARTDISQKISAGVFFAAQDEY